MSKPAEASVPAIIAATAAFYVVVLIHLVGQLFSPASAITEVSQVLLMATLGVKLWVNTHSPRGRLVQLGLAALFFSWVGDTLPRFLDGDGGFLAMIGGFLVAQACYVVAFWPYRKNSILSKPLLIIPYALAAIALVALCGEGAGSLLVPVIVYAIVILAMAVLATGLGPYATAGGVIFLVSDALIALRAFADFTLPAHGFFVMLTYIVGQGLLVYAIQTVANGQQALRHQPASTLR